MYAITDTFTMATRMLKHQTRSVDTIITVVIMPVMIMLAFAYIFGGAMNVPGGDYKAFIVPGILLFCVASGVSYTAYRLNDDVTKGIFERFASMPISRSATLGGHVVTSVLFNAFSVGVVTLVSLLIGFRPKAGLIDWLLVVGLLVLFIIGCSWMSVFFGLISGNGETASIFTYPLMALIFTSSSFAPTATMPSGLRVFADHQPLTPIIDTLRALLAGDWPGADLGIAIGWCVGLWVVFQAGSVWAFRRKLNP
jgi:ABC-2 type transport system permease protein